MTAERLDEFSRAWLSRDVEALATYLSADAVYTPTDGRAVRGRDAVRARFAEMLAEDDGAVVTFDPAIVRGSMGLCHWHLKSEAGEVRGVDVYEFDRGLIRSKDAYRKS